MTNNRANVEWVSITDILPNPLNPRKNDAIKTEEMQAIIKKRGWEIPLTVYKKGKMYVVLAGHRRLYAARTAKIKELPVFVVSAPSTHQEEIERIASLQSGQVDWTPFEWARFTYERWIAWGQPGITKFAKDINLKVSTVENYISVLNYYPMHEIEAGLKGGYLSITTLRALVDWLRALEKHHPDMVSALTIDMIRKAMIDKATSRTLNREVLRRLDFIAKADDELLKEFIFSKEMTLEAAMLRIDLDIKKKSFHGTLVSLGMLRKNVTKIEIKSKDQAQALYNMLEEIKLSVGEKMRHVESQYPEIRKEQELNTFLRTNRQMSKK